MSASGDFLLELIIDEDQAQFVEDILTGEPPIVPSDPILFMRYVIAAGRAKRAVEAGNTGVLDTLAAIRATGYSSKDYARADYVA